MCRCLPKKKIAIKNSLNLYLIIRAEAIAMNLKYFMNTKDEY